MTTNHLNWATVLSLFVLQLPLPASGTVAPGSAAEILSLQGAGEQRPTQGDAWQPARPKQLLGNGAFVRTLPAARMALLFSDDTQVRLNQNSVLQLKSVGDRQQPTTMSLSFGRAWAQTKRAPDSQLILETPAAVAAIRGTDWELDVDASGKTLLTVLSGSVVFSNAQGSVMVASNEAAIAEVGRAPIKILLSNPRDRIQWVNALTADPLRHLPADQVPATLKPVLDALAQGDMSLSQAALGRAAPVVPAPWIAVMVSAQAMLADDAAAARLSLTKLLAQPDSAPLAAYLLLSDLDLISGEFAAAASTLEAGLIRHAENPDLLAQLARTQLLADQVADSEKTLARARNADVASVLVAKGELARRQGLASATIQAFEHATRVAPTDDRGWFGLGSAQNEREDSVLARLNLSKALQLRPRDATYRGELGTLETFANRFAQADRAFAEALALNPADYVALTGLGLLRLKQGQPEAALDAFMRAGVMEPRYARAKTYTAVAYYQMGRHRDAIDTLSQASTLDDKDPVPYLFLSQIYTDLFRPAEAVQASRDAVKRLPYLKSLNQVANDQKGSANFGAALAFFGMEEWALELAQQSFYPYWGGSHLFLADRYPGEFNKNSELFQGYLSDPLAFGASNRFSSLLQRSGHYGAVELNVDKSDARLSLPSLTLNGLSNATIPLAYFVQAQGVNGSGFPIDIGMSNQPAMADPAGGLGVGASIATLGFGARPIESLGVFAYGNDVNIKLNGSSIVELLDDSIDGTDIDNKVRQTAIGLSYRWSPASQTWLKLGRSNEATVVAGYPTVFFESGLSGLIGLYASLNKSFDDIQFRHTADWGPYTRVSLGLEQVNEVQRAEVAAIGYVEGEDGNGGLISDVLIFGGSNNINRRFKALTLSAQHRPVPAVLFDGAMVVNRISERVVGENAVGLQVRDLVIPTSVRTDVTQDRIAPRFGVVFQPSDWVSVRAAYQDWVRPLSVSTLNSVETAGIPLEDRLVVAGGRLKRSVVQVGLTLDERTFLVVKADYQRIHNPVSPGADLRTPSLPFLEALRNPQSVNLSTIDVLEEIPDFEDGTVHSYSIGVNRLLTSSLSGYARYTLQDSSSDYADPEAPTGRVGGKRIPYLPRDTLVLGATWANSQRTYLSGRLIYRSERFEEQANLTRWPPGWSADVVATWETSDKRWAIGAGALNLGGAKSSRQSARYVLDARYRF